MSEVVEPGRVLEMIGGRAGYRSFVQEELKERDREEYYRSRISGFWELRGLARSLSAEPKKEEVMRPKKSLSVFFVAPRMA
ncbi:MAG TPA: hypothetical protein VMR88_08665 [Candidatus Polarisedimenticolaceae bacterium]|nr:hypothetical protein [Candidatus Polarisedimenticolaceae bacterium]